MYSLELNFLSNVPSSAAVQLITPMGQAWGTTSTQTSNSMRFQFLRPPESESIEMAIMVYDQSGHYLGYYYWPYISTQALWNSGSLNVDQPLKTEGERAYETHFTLSPTMEVAHSLLRFTSMYGQNWTLWAQLIDPTSAEKSYVVKYPPFTDIAPDFLSYSIALSDVSDPDSASLHTLYPRPLLRQSIDVHSNDIMPYPRRSHFMVSEPVVGSQWRTPLTFTFEDWTQSPEKLNFYSELKGNAQGQVAFRLTQALAHSSEHVAMPRFAADFPFMTAQTQSGNLQFTTAAGGVMWFEAPNSDFLETLNIINMVGGEEHWLRQDSVFNVFEWTFRSGFSSEDRPH